MPVSLDAFRSLSFQSTDPNQKIFVKGDELKNKSSFFSLRTTARANENIATVRAFVEALRLNPIYANHLNNITDITEQLIAERKPLTMRDVQQVMSRLANSVQTNIQRNEQLFDRLVANNSFSVNQVNAFRNHIVNNNIDISQLENPRGFMANYLKDSMLADMVKSFCPHKDSAQLNSFIEFLKQTTSYNQLIESVLPNPFSLNDIPPHFSENLAREVEIFADIFNNLDENFDSFPQNNFGRKIFETTLHGLKSNLLTNMEIPSFVDKTLQVLEKDFAMLDSIESKNEVLLDFSADNFTELSMLTALSKKGLPESLGHALSANPSFMAEVKQEIKNLDVRAEDFFTQFEETMLNCANTFLENNREALESIIHQFDDPTRKNPFEKEELPLYINTILRMNQFVELMINPQVSTDPIALATKFADLNSVILASIKDPSQHNDTELITKILANSLKFLLPEENLQACDKMLATIYNIHEDFTKILSDPQTPVSEINSPEHDKLVNSLGALYKIANFLKEELVAQGTNPDKVLFMGKSINTIIDDFIYLSGASSAETDFIKSLDLILQANFSKTNQAQFDKFINLYLHTSSTELFNSPPDFFVNFINQNKEELGLGALTDADLAKISTSSFIDGVNLALKHLESQIGGNIREEDIKASIEKSLKSQLTTMGQTLKQISESSKIKPEHKIIFSEIVLSSELRDIRFFEEMNYNMNSIISSLDSVLNNMAGMDNMLPKIITHITSILSQSQHAGVKFETYVPAILKSALTHCNNQENISALVKAMDSQAMSEFSDVINFALAETQTVLGGNELNSNQRTDITKGIGNLLSINIVMAHLRSVANHRVEVLEGNQNAPIDINTLYYSMRPQPDNARSFHKDMMKLVYDKFSSSTRNLIYSSEFMALTSLQGKISQAEHNILLDVGKRLKLSDSNSALFGLEKIPTAYYKNILEAAKKNPDLTPSELYTAIIGKKAPKNITEGNMARVIMREILSTVHKYTRKINPSANEDTDMFYTVALLNQNLTHNDAIKLHQGKLRLNLENLSAPPTMSGLTDYAPSTAYGLKTDFRRRDHQSVYTFESLRSGTFTQTPHKISDRDNVPTNPTFTRIISFVESMSKSEKQKAVILQCLTQAASVNFRMFAEAVGLGGVSEHGDYDTNIKETENGDVIVGIKMKPSMGLDGYLEFTVKPDGSYITTAFDFGLAKNK